MATVKFEFEGADLEVLGGQIAAVILNGYADNVIDVRITGEEGSPTNGIRPR